MHAVEGEPVRRRAGSEHTDSQSVPRRARQVDQILTAADVEAAAGDIDEGIGRAIVRLRRHGQVVTLRHAHDHVARVVAGDRILRRQRVALEAAPMREPCVFDFDAELARPYLGEPVLEAFAIAVRERQEVSRLELAPIGSPRWVVFSGSTSSSSSGPTL